MLVGCQLTKRSGFYKYTVGWKLEPSLKLYIYHLSVVMIKPSLQEYDYKGNFLGTV